MSSVSAKVPQSYEPPDAQLSIQEISVLEWDIGAF
jgi:hypothetical protein